MPVDSSARHLSATPTGLHVIRDRRAVGPGMAFLAQRSSPSPASHWILHLTTSETVGELTRVVPAPVAQCLDVDGALALIFQSSVCSVQIDVTGRPGAQDVWQFWLDGGRAH